MNRGLTDDLSAVLQGEDPRDPVMAFEPVEQTRDVHPRRIDARMRNVVAELHHGWVGVELEEIARVMNTEGRQKEPRRLERRQRTIELLALNPGPHGRTDRPS